MRSLTQQALALRLVFAAVLCSALVLLAASPSRAGGGDLDIGSWLRRPGVKLVAVEFYADWCAPCKASVPKWRALHDKYRKDGLRLIVVAVGENGDCANPGWDPDQVVCDLDGSIQERLGAKALPQAFVWSWQGNLLAKHAGADEVERAIEKYFADAPRILVEPGTTSSTSPAAKASAEELRELVQAELGKLGKLDVVASAADRERLAALRKQVVTDERYAEKSRCELGQEVSPNSTLKPRVVSPDGKSQTVVLEVYSLERGCMVESESTRVIGNDLNAAVVEGVHAIIERLTGGNLKALAAAPQSSPPPVASFAPRDIGGAAPAWTPNVAQTFIVGFQSNPAGAVVMLDGKLLCQATPCSREVEVGKHTLSMQAEEYLERREAFSVTRSDTVKWALAPNFATVSVTTTPPGLDIEVDGKVVGQSPLGSLRLPPGKHTVKATSPCHETVGKEFAVTRGETLPLSFTPPVVPAGIKVSVTDSSGDAVVADVLVDGTAVGKSPGVFAVPVCSRTIEVSSSGTSAKTQLMLRAKETARIDLALNIAGRTTISSVPPPGYDRGTPNTQRLSGPAGAGSVRSRPWVLFGFGVAALGVGIGANVANAGLEPSVEDGRLTLPNRTPTAVTAIAGYGLGGALLLGAIIDWAAIGYHDNFESSADARMPTLDETAESNETRPPRVVVSPRIGIGSVALHGEF